MSYVITLAAPRATPNFADEPIRFLEAAGIALERRDVLAPNRAIDLYARQAAPRALMDNIRAKFALDIFCQHSDTRAKKLFLADMDSTMVEQETLDELAGHAGLKEKISAITARSMAGELDFAQAIHQRVGLLSGLSEIALQETHAKTTFCPGAETLLRTLKNHGIYCVLVSGGFTYFTAKVAESLGFDEHHGNTLLIENGALTGKVALPIQDRNYKQQCLMQIAERMGIALSETVAIGDGANDLPMLQTAGLGMGWRSKQILRDSLDNHILLGGLETLLFAMGIKH